MRRLQRHRALLVMFLFFILIDTLAGQVAKGHYKGRKAAAQEVLVKFRETSPRAAATMAKDYDLSSMRRLGGVANLYRAHSRSHDISKLMTEFTARADVIYSEPNYEWQALDIPNDPQFASQWGLQNSGQSGVGFAAGTAGADISAVPAWDVSTGDGKHVVGVVDTGIDYTHPDLQANIWSAPSAFTVNLNGVLVTCPAGSHGFNAIDVSCDPMDDHMHGTHVSGIIGASGNNSSGVVGVNWRTQIIGLKFLDAQGYGYTSDAITAIEFGIQVKAVFASANAADIRILSNSWGGGAFSQALQDEIDVAASNDILFVAAAGNSSSNLDIVPMYPASYNRANMIAVAATDNNDVLASFSSYGATSVHLGAPGVAILSTLPGSSYGYLSGTSMATPHVSGAATLLLSACSLSTQELKQDLLDNVDPIPSLAGLTATGGRLNVNRAIHSCNGPVGLSPALIPFNTVPVGRNSKPVVVRLTNNQALPLTLSGIVVTGEFAQSNNCGTALAPKTGCAINVVFTPSSQGPKSGQLQIFDDAATSPQIADLTGTGIIAPDLVGSAATSATLSSPGSTITVDSTLSNQGIAVAVASVAGVYLSASGRKDSTAVVLATFGVPALQPGENIRTQTPGKIPAGVAAGSYYVITCADDTNLVAESDETNNCGASATAIQVQLPDLIESSVSFGQVNSQTLQVSDTASNQGLVDGLASVTQYYVGFFATKSSGASLLGGNRRVPDLPAGASSQGVTNLTLPSNLAVGNYYILACADDTALVAEINESNNCAAATSKLSLGPDLIESSVSTSTTSAGAGATFTATDVTVNQGVWDASTSLTRYYFSPFTTKNNYARLLGGNRQIGVLTPGGSSLGYASVTIPADMGTGSYYLLACADDTALVAETNENNNCAASSTKIQVGPDLVESGVSSAKLMSGPGASIGVSDTTSNQGGGDAGASFTQYYLGAFTTKTNARLLSGNRAVPGLPGGSSSQASATVTIPSSMPVGNYYLLACTDDTALVAETNESNNCAASSTKIQVGPDLMESGVSSANTSATPGGLMVVSDTTTNQGGGDGGASFTQYYLGSFTTKVGARLLTGNRPVPGLVAGSGSQASVTVTVPSTMPAGSYYLLACADDTNLVPETSESNNCAASSTKIQVGSDLIESGVSSASTITGPGASIAVSDTATNQGGGDAGASLTQYYLGPFTTKNAARLLSGNRPVPALAAGNSSQGSVTVTVPTGIPAGNYYLLACADDTGVVPETNENNNCTASATKVQVGPDLIESGVGSASTTSSPGASIVVSDTTSNQGGGDAGASFTQYYLGPFTTKVGARLLSGNRAVAGLPGGSSSQASATATVPSSMPAGSYYLLACADDTSLVAETSESNNCAASGTKIRVGP